MSPTLIGWTKVMAVMATVATRPLATRAASVPPAMSIWRQHPAAENVAISVHIGRLGNGPYDRIAATFGHQFPTGYGCFSTIFLPYG